MRLFSDLSPGCQCCQSREHLDEHFVFMSLMFPCAPLPWEPKSIVCECRLNSGADLTQGIPLAGKGGFYRTTVQNILLLWVPLYALALPFPLLLV